MAGVRWEAMSVREYTKQDGTTGSFWTKVGSGFTNRDGSIGIQLDAFPLDGKIILQIPLTKEQKDAKFAQNRQQQQAPRQGGGQQQRYRQPQSNQQTFQQPRAPQAPQYQPDPDANPFDDGGGFSDDEIPH